MRLTLALLAAVLAACGGCAPILPEVRPIVSAEASGAIPFATVGSLVRTADGGSFSTGDPVTISGELRFPDGTGPFPAVILAHGCNGNRGIERAWGSALRAWGYATFVIDSFGARGLKEVCTNGRALTPTQRIPDAYGALRLLAAHPRIDPRRIALMGFSHGGALTMGAATVWAKETYAPAGRPSFSAFLPFYPNCNAVYPERERISAPLRIHTGELDDWTPAAACVRLANVGNGSKCFLVAKRTRTEDPAQEGTPSFHDSVRLTLGTRERHAYAQDWDRALGGRLQPPRHRAAIGLHCT